MRKTANRVAAAGQQAAVFLLPPHESPTARADALLAAAELARQAIEHAVKAGRDDLAMKLLTLAQDMEACPK